MPVAIAGRAPATFEIKSANLPLVALLLKSTDLQHLGDELHARFGDMPDFFDDDALVIDLSPLRDLRTEAVPDFRQLVELLRRFRVMPIAVKGGSDEQMRAAKEAGLANAADAVSAVIAGSTRNPETAPDPRRDWMPDQVRHDSQLQGSPPAAAPVPAPVPQGALVIHKPLRSGQQVYARGRDLVVMSMVNPGAEVIADGHIHVYAPLRGKAMAGARGNADARIFTMSLQPELISIAGVYRTSEVPWPKELQGKPAQIRLDGGADQGKLLVERLV